MGHSGRTDPFRPGSGLLRLPKQRRQEDSVRFRNDATETAPANALMEVTGWVEDAEVHTLTCDKPGYFTRPAPGGRTTRGYIYAVNVGHDAEAGKDGECTLGPVAEVLFNDVLEEGVRFGDSVGPSPDGGWAACIGSNWNSGWDAIGGPENGRVKILLSPLKPAGILSHFYPASCLGDFIPLDRAYYTHSRGVDFDLDKHGIKIVHRGVYRVSADVALRPTNPLNYTYFGNITPVIVARTALGAEEPLNQDVSIPAGPHCDNWGGNWYGGIASSHTEVLHFLEQDTVIAIKLINAAYPNAPSAVDAWGSLLIQMI